jgi:sugar porter (SP) family MFS transporter
MASFERSFGALSATKHGAVVSAILFPAAFSGLFAGNVADIYGRSTTMGTGGFIFGLGAAIECSAQSLGNFIAGRAITGFGEGLFLGTLVTYIVEIAPARRRGPLASLVQFLVTVGVAAGYFISFGTARIGSSSLSWRLPLAFHAFVSLFFAAACTVLPPSPRWLLANGRVKEARDTLERLGLSLDELDEMIHPPEDDTTSIAQTSLFASIKAKFKDFGKVVAKDSRKQTALACFLMTMMQLSGIDGVLYYAPLLFRQAGLASEEASFLASGVSALVMLAVTIPASYYADHWGRRISSIVGGALLSACMIIIGSLYAANKVYGDHGAARYVVVACIYIFAVVFCVTWAIGFRIYASEIQPHRTRASAASLAQSANWIANWLVAFTTPIMLARSSFAAYFFFGGATFITFVVCLVAMPETKGKSLESIDMAFKDKSSGWSLNGATRRRRASMRLRDDNELVEMKDFLRERGK